MTTTYKLLSTHQILNVAETHTDAEGNITILFTRERKPAYVRKGTLPSGRPLGSKNRKSKNIHGTFEPTQEQINNYINEDVNGHFNNL